MGKYQIYGIPRAKSLGNFVNFRKKLTITRKLYFRARKDVDNFFKEGLRKSWDGRGLQDAAEVPAAHRWVGDGTRFLNGRDYIRCIKMRIDAMPCKARTGRGRPSQDKACRAGCLVQETLYHSEYNYRQKWKYPMGLLN